MVFTGLPVWGILEIIFSVLCDLVSRNQSVGFWCWELDNPGIGITHLCPELHSETLFPVSYLVKCRPRCPCSEEKKSSFSVFLPVLTWPCFPSRHPVPYLVLHTFYLRFFGWGGVCVLSAAYSGDCYFKGSQPHRVTFNCPTLGASHPLVSSSGPHSGVLKHSCHSLTMDVQASDSSP